MSAIISDRLKSMDPNYTAIHVRNTDYKTDFQSFFKRIVKKTNGEQLLVCSDDAGVLDAAREYFVAARIITVSQPPRSGGRPLHDIDTYASGEEMKESAIDSLVDLIALGNAPRLYVTSVTLGNLSGFSGLAAFLCDHKELIGRLLGHDIGTSHSNAGKGARRLVPLKFRLLKLLPRFMRKTLHWQ
ncbi:MAG: hypothetical protein GY933_16190 [Hyphomicrobiales bacterium]|nr:hypothetical protein [Hyphomicrobiales bacterium]